MSNTSCVMHCNTSKDFELSENNFESGTGKIISQKIKLKTVVWIIRLRGIFY